MTRPWRRITLHLSQIFLTLGLTFMSSALSGSAGGLLVPVDDPTPREVVRRELHHHAVLGEDPDVVLAHLAADVGQDLVPVAQLDPEHRVRESLDDGALDLDHTFFFRHVLTSGRGSSRLPSTREPPGARTDDGVVRRGAGGPLVAATQTSSRARTSG